MIPKLSGEGLKRSTTLRVQGYCEEADRAFAKADEVCERLNRENVRSNDLPPWVRKTYSVPKPVGYEPGRFYSGLTGAEVRRIREKVMADELLPLGFTKGNAGTYVRQHGDQIHLIDFQASQYGGHFYVNLGFHYAFVPPLFHRGLLALSEFHLLDCLFTNRIELLATEPLESHIRYGTDKGELKAQFVQCAANALLILDETAAAWREPSRALSDVEAKNHRWKFDAPVSAARTLLLQTDDPIIAADTNLSELVNLLYSRRASWIIPEG